MTFNNFRIKHNIPKFMKKFSFPHCFGFFSSNFFFQNFILLADPNFGRCEISSMETTSGLEPSQKPSNRSIACLNIVLIVRLNRLYYLPDHETIQHHRIEETSWIIFYKPFPHQIPILMINGAIGGSFVDDSFNEVIFGNITERFVR